GVARALYSDFPELAGFGVRVFKSSSAHMRASLRGGECSQRSATLVPLSGRPMQTTRERKDARPGCTTPAWLRPGCAPVAPRLRPGCARWVAAAAATKPKRKKERPRPLPLSQGLPTDYNGGGST